MKHRITPDALTLASLYVETFYGDERLGIASGFPWRSDGSDYLVTNGHVLSGIHPETGQPISKQGSTPDRINVWIHQRSNLGSWSAERINLYDSQGRPVWYEHPVHGSKADVSAIPLEVGEEFRLFPINQLEYVDFRLEVSQEVFVIGFPKGLTGSGKFPIWKRGSIASEPDVDLDGLPKMLIDSATREGMSGSPVIVQYVGYYPADPPNPSPQDWFGRGRQFLGVYSGRMRAHDELEAQLGYVWKSTAIQAVVDARARPT